MTMAVRSHPAHDALRMVLLPCLLASATYAHAQVELSFKNRTGHRIEGLTFAGMELGGLAADGSMTFRVDSVLLCGPIPCAKPTGHVPGIRMSEDPPEHCVTRARYMQHGRVDACIHLTDEFFSGRELRLVPCTAEGADNQ
jgi:hypothetical protein